MKNVTNIILNIWIAASAISTDSHTFIYVMMMAWLAIGLYEWFISWKYGE
jgi:hypothetical protein